MKKEKKGNNKKKVKVLESPEDIDKFFEDYFEGNKRIIKILTTDIQTIEKFFIDIENNSQTQAQNLKLDEKGLLDRIYFRLGLKTNLTICKILLHMASHQSFMSKVRYDNEKQLTDVLGKMNQMYDNYNNYNYEIGQKDSTDKLKSDVKKNDVNDHYR